jgi:hypothetical protein
LAKALSTPVAVLQGDAPDESVSAVTLMEAQLRRQLASTPSDALLKELKRFEDSEERDPVPSLAGSLASEIEATLIGAQEDTIARICDVTGWSKQELGRTQTVNGHWLLVVSYGGLPTMELLNDPTAVKYDINEAIESAGSLLPDDRIAIREELPWTYITVYRRSTVTVRISFTRCMPHSGGLHWVNPNWRDRFWLHDDLFNRVSDHVNFIETNGSVLPQNLRNLRLLAEVRETGVHEAEARWQTLAVIRGDIDDIPEHTWNSFKKEGELHDLVTNWIASGVWTELAAAMRPWPAESWKVRASGWCITVELDLMAIFRHHRATGEPESPRIAIRLRLVEEVVPGELKPVPWRPSSVEQVAAKLLKSIVRDIDGVG